MKNRQESYEDIPIRNSGNQRKFTSEETRSIRAWLKINWSQINLEQFRRGLEVELEKGADDPETNATRDASMLGSEQPAVA
jgi:Trm5-related predicted tRNA methylase